MKITETTGDMLKKQGSNGRGRIPKAKKFYNSPERMIDLTGEGDIDIMPKPTLGSPVMVQPIPEAQINATGNATDATNATQPYLKVAIVGTAPSSRDLAPFNDPSWEIWACSPGNAHGVLPRADVWFEIHSNFLWPENQSYGIPYLNWIKDQKGKIKRLYMQDQSLVDWATPLPIQELINEHGKYFFTSSFAYMIAMAILHGAKEIALFGVDMASKDEYILQRPGGHYFMQEAAKRGIKVQVPHESDLAMHPPLYGFDCSTPFMRKLHVRKLEIKQRVDVMSNEIAQKTHGKTYLEGALEDLDYVQSIFGGLQT
jgi:hypothetical protein